MAGRDTASSNRTAPSRPKLTGDRLGPEHVAEIQRVRMLIAMSEVASELGASNVTVALVVQRAGVSRRTFYELFEDCEECFLATFDEAVKRASRYVLPALWSDSRWRERMRCSLIALLSFIECEPFMSRLLVLESSGAGLEALQRRRVVLAWIAAVVDEGRREMRTGNEPPPLIAEGVVGGVFSVLHDRLLERSPGGLMGLVNPLMSMIVLPYLGLAASRRELERPVPEQEQHGGSSASNPLKELEMRLTYRTVRVLGSVATNPRSSNRVVADDSGIVDQGQISKLLARLGKLGLIENVGGGPVRGAPNAWMLTKRGKEVHDVIAAQTPHA